MLYLTMYAVPLNTLDSEKEIPPVTVAGGCVFPKHQEKFFLSLIMSIEPFFVSLITPVEPQVGNAGCGSRGS